MMKKLIG